MCNACEEGGKYGTHLLFFPMMPPRMQRGMVTKAQMTEITTMVPKGNACVDCSTMKGFDRHSCMQPVEQVGKLLAQYSIACVMSVQGC